MRKYKTREAAERAIKRMEKRGPFDSFELVPHQGADGTWTVELEFSMEVKARGAIYQLEDIRREVAAAELDADVKKYFEDALWGAIVALREIGTVFSNGDAVERNCGDGGE